MGIKLKAILFILGVTFNFSAILFSVVNKQYLLLVLNSIWFAICVNETLKIVDRLED